MFTARSCVMCGTGYFIVMCKVLLVPGKRVCDRIKYFSKHHRQPFTHLEKRCETYVSLGCVWYRITRVSPSRNIQLARSSAISLDIFCQVCVCV